MTEETRAYKIIFHESKDGTNESLAYIETLALKKHKSKDARVKYNKIIQYLEILSKYGTTVGEPYIKHIENTDGLYELRPLRDRFFFVYEIEETYVILNHFVKMTQKTPQREIKKALKLIKERNNQNEK